MKFRDAQRKKKARDNSRADALDRIFAAKQEAPNKSERRR